MTKKKEAKIKYLYLFFLHLQFVNVVDQQLNEEQFVN
jgi:hypothetical protein